MQKIDLNHPLSEIPSVKDALRTKFVHSLNNIFQNTPNYETISADAKSLYDRFDSKMMNKLVLALEDNNDNKEQKRLELVEKLRREIEDNFIHGNPTSQQKLNFLYQLDKQITLEYIKPLEQVLRSKYAQ